MCVHKIMQLRTLKKGNRIRNYTKNNTELGEKKKYTRFKYKNEWPCNQV